MPATATVAELALVILGDFKQVRLFQHGSRLSKSKELDLS
jgi:hypothetical protein